MATFHTYIRSDGTYEIYEPVDSHMNLMGAGAIRALGNAVIELIDDRVDAPMPTPTFSFEYVGADVLGDRCPIEDAICLSQQHGQCQYMHRCH